MPKKKQEWAELGDMESEAEALVAKREGKSKSPVVKMPKKKKVNNKANDKEIIEQENNFEMEQLKSLSDLVIFLPQSIVEAKERVTDTMSQIAMKSAEMGFYLLYIKERAKHGEFKDYLSIIAVSSQRASEYMNIARMLMAMPEEERRKLLKQGKSKLLELSKITPEVAEQAAKTGVLDDIDLLTAKELRDKLRNAKSEIEKRDLKIVELEDRQAADNQKPNRWPEGVLKVREESVLAGLQIQTQVDELESQLNLMESKEFAASLTEGAQSAIELDAAMGTVYQAVSSSLLRLHRLMDVWELRKLKHFTVEDLVPELDDVELKRIGDMWRPLQQIAERERAERHVERTNKARRGKRGRPVGSKNKA